MFKRNNKPNTLQNNSNKIPLRIGISKVFGSIFGSYSQVFFSENRIFGGILLFITFFDVVAGICGLLSVASANFVAYILGFNRFKIEKGSYGFNALLVGLGLGLNFQFSEILIITVVFAALLTLFITLAIEGIFYKYGLSFLSLPFLFGIWIVTLAVQKFNALELSERGIFFYNELFWLGGKDFILIYEKLILFPIPQSLKIYFTSLGAIFFQTNVLAGVFIAVGLLYYSRIAFLLSLFGFYTAFFFYTLTGADFYGLSYTYVGFNYILSSIALGGFFILPSRKSFLLVLFMLPVTVLVTTGFEKIFSILHLAVYSLPFNFIVLMMIYILKLRDKKDGSLNENFINYASPEKNLYLNRAEKMRFKDIHLFRISLPFRGEWIVSQAHNGNYTHKEAWRHAWDFVIEDADGKQFKENGDFCDNYFCYGKPVIAPADGVVADIGNNVEDNKIGDINTIQNWGNSIVIKHTEYLYSQLSHLKPGSIKVQTGDYVKQGQVIAAVGNTGHSPYPHLHFQLQAYPYIGSQTLEYPIFNFITKTEKGNRFSVFGNPKEKNKIRAAEEESLLKEAFRLLPGQQILVEKQEDGKTLERKWAVEKTMYNQSYIRCLETGAVAYFYTDEHSFFFQNFYGNTDCELFLFYSALYHVRFVFCENFELKDYFRTDLFFNRFILFFQDFAAPFVHFISAKYRMKYISKNSDINTSEIKISTEAVKRIMLKKVKYLKSEITVLSKVQFEIAYRRNKTQGILKTKLIN